MPKVKVTIRSEVKLCCSSTTEANLIKLHRKIKHNEKVCCAHDLGFCAQGQGLSQVSGQNSVSAITQKLLKHLTKLHRKIEDNEKVCHTQEFGSYAQGQGHNQVRGQIVPKIVLLINY